jgi:adenosylmethionine-8-amino-7-oxononanoate aminotransferase
VLAHCHVGDIRGLGLLVGIEFVSDKATRAAFEPSQGIAEKIRVAAMEEGVLTYPTQGCVDGMRGDHILLAPPFIITAEESALISRALASALAKVFPE